MPEREPFPKLVLSSCHRVQYLSLNRGVRKNEINECMSIVMRGADADTAVHTAALRERVGVVAHWLVLGSAEVEEIIAMRKERVAMRDKGDVEHRD